MWIDILELHSLLPFVFRRTFSAEFIAAENRAYVDTKSKSTS